MSCFWPENAVSFKGHQREFLAGVSKNAVTKNVIWTHRLNWVMEMSSYLLLLLFFAATVSRTNAAAGPA